MTGQPAYPAVLHEALEAHGGLARWRTFERLTSTIVTGGLLWPLKGVEQSPIPRAVTTDLRHQRSTFVPFAADGSTMSWAPEHVAIIRGNDVIAERLRPREAFDGHVLETRWDKLHLAYFQGYAMWTYHALPFELAGRDYELREIAPIIDDGVELRGISARFPPRIESHSRDQRFYFGSDGLLRRHDYEVSISGGSPAAHFLHDYADFAGFKFPTRRIVHPLGPDGAIDRSTELVTIALSDYRLQ